LLLVVPSQAQNITILFRTHCVPQFAEVAHWCLTLELSGGEALNEMLGAKLTQHLNLANDVVVESLKFAGWNPPLCMKSPADLLNRVVGHK